MVSFSIVGSHRYTTKPFGFAQGSYSLSYPSHRFNSA